MQIFNLKPFMLTLLSILLLSGLLLSDTFAQDSGLVRSSAGTSSLTVKQLTDQVQTLRGRNTTQQSTIDANEAEMQSIEDDTATQQTRIDNLHTELTAAQPTGKDLDDRAAAAKADAQTIKPHAKTALPGPPSCVADQKLYWTGAAWNCISEADSTLGVHGTVAKTPPACALDEKTIWNGTNWTCQPELDVTGAAGPAGPDGAAGADGIDGGGIWQYGTGGEIYYNAGIVGVGGAVQSGWRLKVTGNALVTGNVDVSGATRTGSGTCSGATEGGMRYNSGTDEVQVCVNGSWEPISVDGAGLCIPPGSCQSPWATWINDGASVTAYQAATVPYGSTCTSQTRTCSSGTLSGSYNFSNCSVNPPASCNLPWGGSVAHGGSVTAYQTSSVSCLNSCNGQTRSCNNGTLSGSYTNQSCTVNACNSCTRPWGGTVAHGGSITAYASASPACGTSCSSQSRTCSDGTLSGSYTNQSCTSKCCLPWGGSINSGSSTTAYQSASVTCGNTCTSQTRTCSGTTLSGSYTNASCSVGGCSSCTRPWGGTVAHGSSITAYQTASVPCGNTCNGQTRTCNNGSLSGTYTNQSCSVGGCTASCTLDGQTVAHGASWTFYTSLSVPCGSTCSGQSRTCSNGVLSGNSSYNRKSCSVSACASCSRPWGGTVAHGSSVTAYQTASVACGSSCTSESRSCNNGTLSGSYTNQSCTVGSCSCTASSGTTYANGSCPVLGKAFGYECHGGCAWQANCCTNGSWQYPLKTHDDCIEEPCCGGAPC